MLKILTIHGSPHKGNTTNITTEFMNKLKNRLDIETKDIILSDENLALCRGCGVCITHGEEKCPSKDRLQSIHSTINDSDLVIMTTPIYALHITALLKNFIERSSYIMHRPCYFGKRFMPLTTQFIGGDKEVAKYFTSAMNYWGFKVIPGLHVTMADDKIRIEKMIDSAVERIAKIEKQKRFPVPKFKDFMAFRFRRSVVPSKSYSGTFPRDLEYFRERGWLQSKYYYDVNLNFMMGLAGKIFDVLGRKMSEKMDKEK